MTEPTAVARFINFIRKAIIKHAAALVLVTALRVCVQANVVILLTEPTSVLFSRWTRLYVYPRVNHLLM